MRIIEPDFDRRIELPGVGPCPRPVDIDQQVTGFRDLVSLRVYSFAAGNLIHGDAETDELFVILLDGAITVAVDQSGVEVGAFALRTDGGPRAVFLPPDASYRLSTTTAADVAYARVLPRDGAMAPVAAFAFTERRLDIPAHASGMAIALASLAAGEALALTASDGALPERLVHLRGNGSVAGTAITGWQTIQLDPGEPARLTIGDAPADVLIVAARSG